MRDILGRRRISPVPHDRRMLAAEPNSDALLDWEDVAVTREQLAALPAQVSTLGAKKGFVFRRK
jgi:hypothetical protein